MIWRLLLAGAAIAALMLVSACNDDSGDGAESTPTDVLEATATTSADVTSTVEPAATPGSDRTGIPELDAIVDALRSGDPEALRPLISFSERPCFTSGLGEPLCGAGEPEGTVVEAFGVGRCEGEFYRPDDTERVLGFLTPQRLYAIYGITPPGSRGDPNAEYAAITSVDSGGSQTAWVVWIAGGRIIGTSVSCGPVPPEEFVEDLGLTDAVLPPDASTIPSGEGQFELRWHRQAER